jgi:hypothetical protein
MFDFLQDLGSPPPEAHLAIEVLEMRRTVWGPAIGGPTFPRAAGCEVSSQFRRAASRRPHGDVVCDGNGGEVLVKMCPYEPPALNPGMSI